MPYVVLATTFDSDRWRELAELSGCPSHQYSHGQALAASGVDPMLAAVVSNNEEWLVMPIHCRSWMGTKDIATTVSVSGARCTGDAKHLLNEWHNYANRQGWVCGYLQFDPLSDLTGLEVPNRGNVSWLLHIQDSDPLRNASTIIRRKIRRAQQLDIKLEQDRARLSDAVCELYPETMRRAQARSIYNYTSESLRQWTHDLNNIVIGASMGDRIIGVVIFLVCSAEAEFHVGAYSLDGRESSAWLLSHALNILSEQGVKAVNLGGGNAYGDGLYQFKKKFGGTEHRHSIITQIYNQRVFDELCRGIEGPLSGQRFPPYRP